MADEEPKETSTAAASAAIPEAAAGDEATTKATTSAEAAASPDSSDKSNDSSSSGSGKFYSLSKSIQKNIETLNYVTKEIEKINDRLLFRSSTITPAEETTLIQKVSHLHKDTSMKVRETARLIRSLRVEKGKPGSVSSSQELKTESEKSQEEKDEESRDMG